jgi:hypothetical protein
MIRRGKSISILPDNNAIQMMSSKASTKPLESVSKASNKDFKLDSAKPTAK